MSNIDKTLAARRALAQQRRPERGEMDAQQFMNEAMTEDQFLEKVLSEFRLRGWLVYHTHDSRRSDAGFPDIVAVRDGRIVFAELKREIPEKCSPSLLEKLTPMAAQRAWLAALDVVALGAYRGSRDIGVYLWRPSSWPEIVEVLR